jgi:LPS-assembly protein
MAHRMLFSLFSPTLRPLLIAAFIVLGLICGLWPDARVRAQDLPASVLADSVNYDDTTGLLTATGNVEVLYQGRILKARQIVYDRDANQIRATGPLVLSDPATGTVLAESAALSPELTSGLIRAARLLIAGQLQIAASEVRRTDDRYTTLFRTFASTCTVCEGSPTPIWAIRAERITQDSEEQRIYFENATFEAFGLPVGYLPRMSIPDPAVRRASGVLVPSLVQSNIYGLGLKVPYYLVRGPYADATLTPFLTTTGAALIEGEYRRELTYGGFELAGVLAVSDGMGDAGRGALTALGDFDLGRGFKARFDINLASDRSFLQQFD